MPARQLTPIFSLSLTLALLLGVAAGCQSISDTLTGQDESSSDIIAAADDQQFGIAAQPRVVAIGDPVTVRLTGPAELISEGAPPPPVRWNAPNASVETMGLEPAIRVRFDQAGTQRITAELLVEGQDTRRDTVAISVRPDNVRPSDSSSE